MPDAVKVGFVPFSTAPRGTLVVFCNDALKFGRAASKVLGASAAVIKRAAATNRFKGKSAATLDILAPEGLKVDRLIVVGVGEASALKASDFLKFGGVIAGKIRGENSAVTIIAELPAASMNPDQSASLASGGVRVPAKGPMLRGRSGSPSGNGPGRAGRVGLHESGPPGPQDGAHRR